MRQSNSATPEIFLLAQRHQFDKTIIARQHLIEFHLNVTSSALNQALRQYGLHPLTSMYSKDSRPNRALEDPTHLTAWEAYRYRSQWHVIIHYSVQSEWKDVFSVHVTVPPNHGSALRVMNIIVKHLRIGQDAN
ncbi:hypothetical protein PHMEG_00015013 [Phytophthora megakarya]|uniref:Uncharacterized protein n=1 Tax=Phytophthora megakarya TaxID=4795 RepID=A0A225W3E9_9STRA|nr:hypothetical protein PHMEG_00015013 [Phytophthora megakarya]